MRDVLHPTRGVSRKITHLEPLLLDVQSTFERKGTFPPLGRWGEFNLLHWMFVKGTLELIYSTYYFLSPTFRQELGQVVSFG